MTVIAVFNQKGGVGKTTTCMNVSAALGLLERNPLAIDLDPQAHLTLSCGLKAVQGADSVAAFYTEDKPLSQLVRELPDGLRLIPAHMELYKVEALYGNSKSIASRLKRGLGQVAQPETPILIDCCPMLGVLSLNAMFAADRVLIPVSTDFLSLQGVQRLDMALRVLEQTLGREVQRKVVMTRFDGRRKLSHDIYNQLHEQFGEDLCETKVAENVSLAESPAHGKNVFAFAPHSQGAKDYSALTEELMTKGFFN